MNLRSAGQSTGSRSLRVELVQPPGFLGVIVGDHSLSGAEDDAVEALRAAGLIEDGLNFHVALVNMSPEVHDLIARCLDAYPGRRKVILWLHSGDKEPTKIELSQRASSLCVEPMKKLLGRYAV